MLSSIDDQEMKEQSEDLVCCAPSDGTTQTDFRALEGPEADDDLAKLAKAIGHPARVRILRMLSRKEARVCSQIVDELPLAQSTVSEHLRILKEAGLVRSSQDGPRVGYCINFDGLRRLKAMVAIIWTEVFLWPCYRQSSIPKYLSAGSIYSSDTSASGLEVVCSPACCWGAPCRQRWILFAVWISAPAVK